MKKQLLTLIFLITVSLFASAQITFQKTFGGPIITTVYSMQRTADGGYVIAALMSGNVCLIKTDANGDTLWTNIYSGPSEDRANAVKQTSDGGYIISGNTNSFGNGRNDVFLSKTDSIGNLLWTKTYGGADEDYSFSVQQTTDGGYVMAGTTYTVVTPSIKVYLVRTDSAGNLRWTKTYGGTGFDGGIGVLQTTGDGFIIFGSTNGSFGAGVDDVYLIRTDSAGNPLWTKTYGGTNEDFGMYGQQTTDGGYIIAGSTESFGAGLSDVYLIKTDVNGDTLWTRTYGGAGNDYADNVLQTADGGYIIEGYTQSFGAGIADVYLIKTDSIGTIIWTKTYGGTGNDWGSSVALSTDGGYFITGYSESFGAGLGNGYLVKTDADGNSGCNEANTATIKGTPPTQVSSPMPTVSSGGTSTSPVMVVYNGCVFNTLCSTVGVNEINLNNSLVIAPNPSAGNFNISFGKTVLKGKVEIVNMYGEIVFTQNIFNELKKEINVENISSGIYFVKVFDGEKYYCKKIIIEHY